MSVDLPTEIAALASALGLTHLGSLDPTFFNDPLSRVKGIISNPDQRSGLLAALDQVMPSNGDTFTTADGQTVTRHPIVQTEVGVVSLQTTTSGSLTSPDLVVGLYARAEHTATTIRVEVDLPIVRAMGTTLDVAAGSMATPMAVSVSVPLGWQRPAKLIGLQSVSLSALVIAPPHLDHSRVLVQLTGLDIGVGAPSDLTFDPMDLSPDFSHALVMLVVAGLKESVGAADDAVVRLIDHLPTVVGLDGQLPALPLGRLISDSSAFRAWLSSLTNQTVGPDPALMHWLDGIAQMLGLPAIPVLATLPTPAAPLVVPLASGGPTDPALAVRIWLDSANASSIQDLHVALEVQISGPKAKLAGRAELLVVPLTGDGPVVCLPSAEVVAESTEPLLTAAGPLTVGIARGGLRWDGTTITPVLEMDNVHVDLAGVVEHATDFPRLDLSHAKTLAAEAKQAVGDFISGALGSGTFADSLLAVLGFSQPPTAAELGAFANDPLRAIGAFHRHALDTSTYGPIAQAIAELFGAQTVPTVAGTADDPWTIPLTGATVPDGSTLGLALSLWDVPDASGHELHLGLSLATPAVAARPGWGIRLLTDLVSFRLPSSAPAQLGVLGATSLAVDIALPELSGVPTRADRLQLRASWQPGAALQVVADLVGLVVSVDGTDLTLGDLSLPDGLSDATIDGSWPAVRELLGRAAGSWGGATGELIAGLIGLRPSPAFPDGWPLLDLSTGHLGDLLGQPMEALRTRLAGLALSADLDGTIPMDVVLDRVRDVLCCALPSRADLPAIPSAPPVRGTGTYEDPWRIPLTDRDTPLVAEPVDLLTWLEPAPPASYTAYAATLLDSDAPDLASALDGLRGLLPDVAAGLAGTDADTASAWLTTAAGYLDGTDGLTTTDIAGAVPAGVQVADTVVTAAHHLAPQSADAVAATRKHLLDNGAAALPTVLIAPSFAPADVWAPLLLSVPAEQQVRVDLRVPGIAPGVVDLSGVGRASHYLVDLADDGLATLDDLAARLHRVVSQVCAVTGAAKVALVGHSTGGTATVAYAGKHPELCQACVTIAAPYLTPAAALFAGGDEASGIRLARSLFPGGFIGAPALGAALKHLASALDGYVGVAPTPYPVKAFARVLPATLDLTAVPTVAITAGLDQPLVVAASATLIAAQGAAATAATAAPTHLAWGLSTDLAIGADSPGGTDPQVAVQARLDLGRVALVEHPTAPAHPEHRLLVDVLVSQPGGWLVGPPGTGAPLDIRLRAAGLRFAATDPANVFTATLYDGAVNGSGLPSISLDDPRAARLMDAFVGRLATAADGSAARALVDLLSALDVVTVDPSTGVAATRADAVTALASDPGGWFRTRMIALLNSRSALVGLAPDAAVSGHPRTWRRALGALPVELVVVAEPWSVGVRTTGAGHALADGAAVSLTALLQLGGAPAIDASITAAGVTTTYHAGVVRVSAPPLLDGLQVFPAAADTPQRLLAALRTTGVAAAVSAVLTDLLGGALPIASTVGLSAEPGQWLADARRLGNGSGQFDPALVTGLLAALGEALGVPSDASGLQIADGMHLAATTDGGTGLRLRLSADQLALAASGPNLDLDLRLDIARGATGWTVLPGASAGLALPLDNGTWPSLTVGVGLAESGVSLSVTPGGQSTIELFPHFGGLWDLLGGGVKALLPGVLDALVADLSPIDPGGVLVHALAVADALGLRTGNPLGFDSQALAELVDQVKSGDLVPPLATIVGLATAALPAGSPITPNVVGDAVQVTMTALPVPGTASLSAAFPGSPKPPTIAVQITDLGLGPVRIEVGVQESGGVLGFTAQVAVAIHTPVGFTFAPALEVSAAPLSIALLPLGTGTALELRLAPDPGIQPDRSALGDLLIAWAEPIVAKAALDAARSLLATPIWTPPAGTPLTALSLLRASALVAGDDAHVQPAEPLPGTPQILRGLLAGLSAFRLPVSPELSALVYQEGPTWLGLGLAGSIDIDAGDFVVSAVFGSPEITAWTDPAPGLGLLLLDDSATLEARPGLRLGGIGVKVAKKGGRLVDTDVVRIGNVTALVQSAIDLVNGSVHATSLHGGVELTDIGLPLGGSSNMSNPVANSLLKPSGSTGDDQPASPPAALQVYSDDSGQLTVRINDKAAEQPFFVDIHKTFGPLHIDQLGLQHLMMGGAGDGIGALVDGGVDIAGLSIDVQGLELAIPLKHPSELDQWTVDLSGLSLSFIAGPVSIAGGLLKTNGPSGIEYDGELKINVASFGLTALGSYAQAKEGDQTYTSLFVFVVVDAPIGGPPFLFVTGLAGGAGYNRQLIVPSDPALIPTYPLIQAMGGPGTSGPDASPMGTLRRMSAAMPARRGSYWVAAGIKFTTFELLNTKALAYVALDRGFEVGLMGVMTMALPTPETALVSVELALGARYSSADQLLAIRAQLTNNSWLISKDCQLTGGFAFYSWFGSHPQVLLTIGGMGPHWFVEPGDTHQYPVVPPVGFHWSVFDGVVVKGETYFALTPRQLAFGGRLEVTGEFGPIRVWFVAWLNVPIEWDPLKYHADFGISIGASFHFTIDLLFTSITISISISLGGSIVIDGPPLHGSVTVDLAIASVTVDFGTFAPPDPPNWAVFAAKFLALTAGPDPVPTNTGAGTSNTTVTYGQLADSSKQAPTPDQQPDGSFGKPWPVLPEFGLQVASKVPLTSTTLGGRPTPGPVDVRPGDLQAGPFSIKPMGSSAPPLSAHLEVHIAVQQAANNWVDVDVSGVTLGPTYGHYPLAVWLVGGQQPPPAHPDMWLTASGAMLGFPVTVLEQTGVLGEASSIPISTLVEESSVVKPLPFTTKAHILAPRIVQPEALAASRPARPARCVAVLLASGSAASATHRLGVPAHQMVSAMSARHAAAPASAAALESGDAAQAAFVTVGTGETHVWRVPSTAAQLRGRGSGRVRVVALSPTGYVLTDQEGVADDLRLDVHPHAERVVVASTEPGAAGPARATAAAQAALFEVAAQTDPAGREPAGWQLGSTLTQVGADTALGARCAVLLPVKAAPPAPAMTERRIAARDLLRGQPGVQTVLPADVDVVIVLLDERQHLAADDLVVSIGNGHDGQGGFGPPVQVVEGTRRVVIYPVAARPTGDRLDVVAASARCWQIAGVVGVAGQAPQWAELLRDAPHADLVGMSSPGVAGAPAQYAFAVREEVMA
jgi:hypothetical protein